MKQIILMLYPNQIEQEAAFERIVPKLKGIICQRKPDRIESETAVMHLLNIFNPKILYGYKADSIFVNERIDISQIIRFNGDPEYTLAQLIESRIRK